MRVVSFVDAFNFYYQCFRGSTKTQYARYKWLDYRALIQRTYPDLEVTDVHVFTAIAANPPDDPTQATRHQVYIDALRGSGIFVHCGEFTRVKREVRLVTDIPGYSRWQTAWVTQEKRSDVGLASQLLSHALLDRCDTAIVVTNDTDFVPAISTVRDMSPVWVEVLSPDSQVAGRLRKAASDHRILDKGLLAVCQLPESVLLENGKVAKRPREWTGAGT